jgi:hypothetical protein
MQKTSFSFLDNLIITDYHKSHYTYEDKDHLFEPTEMKKRFYVCIKITWRKLFLLYDYIAYIA